MADLPLRFEMPDHLCQMVRQQTAIVVVGAGVSVSATNGAPSASWRGLLSHGLRHCVEFGKPKLTIEAAREYERILESNDVDSWLAIATLIERKLKYPNSREWAKWLSESVGSLSVNNHYLIEAILSLRLPVITTNYDSVFEDPTLSRPLHSVTWNTPFFDQLFLTQPQRYIFHLHGHYGDPEGVVLGISSYSKLLVDDATQVFTRLMSANRGLVFVGYGNAWDDPNFSQLLRFISSYGSAHRHYSLVLPHQVGFYEQFNNIYPVVYGNSYDDLPVYVRSLPFGRERYLFSRPKGFAELLTDGAVFQDLPYCPSMVAIRPATYRRPNGAEVRLRHPFAISQAPVTIAEWQVFVDETAYKNRKFVGNTFRSDMPVVGITFRDALAYCSWISAATGQEYRLPSETEWELVAAAGSSSKYWWGDSPSIDRANYRESQLGSTTPVRRYGPNPLGVYDLNGNVWEWCSDNCSLDEKLIPDDGRPFLTKESGQTTRAEERILKGGCFYYDAEYMTSFARIHLEEDVVFNSVGLRLIRSIGATIEAGRQYFIAALAAPYAVAVLDDGSLGVSFFDMRPNQIWEVESVENGASVRMINPASGIVLGWHGRPVDYDKVTAVDVSSLSAAWLIEKAPGGYLLRAGATSKVLDAEGGRARRLPDLILFERHGNFNQVWNFVPRT